MCTNKRKEGWFCYNIDKKLPDFVSHFSSLGKDLFQPLPNLHPKRPSDPGQQAVNLNSRKSPVQLTSATLPDFQCGSVPGSGPGQTHSAAL
ncbi:MAG: hypothetical protein WD077_12250 [Bacteroidia bacterium]